MLKRLIACVAVLWATVAYAQPTAFTFQGRLDSAGSPVSGLYDFEFRLYDDATVGFPDTLIAGPISFSGASALTVTNGTFTAVLDFGLSPYANGSGRFVEVRTRLSGAPSYTTLSPRQQVTSAPYAMTAKNLPIPFAAFGPSSTGSTAAFEIDNTGAGGSGITTVGPTWGLVGFGGPLASYIPILTPAGVFGIGTAIGVGGTSVSGTGVYGASDTGEGGLFVANSAATANALHAQVFGATGGFAGLFETLNAANSNPALKAQSSSTQSNAFAVHGLISSTSANAFSSGVRGENASTSGSGIGVWGSQNGSGYGVYGTAPSGYGVIGTASGSTGLNYGVYGSSGSAAGYAGYFSGRVNVTGALSKGGGSFKIDHPLDPENKFLYHSFVESPDMKNIYDGVVTTDGRGYATVQLPDWFSALNSDLRYQLTVIDAVDSESWTQAKIVHEVEDNAFTLRTSVPNTKVSWQVTGIRKDPWAQKNRIPVEEMKSDTERGKYLYPAAYGLPADRAINPLAQSQAPSQQAGAK